MPQTLLAANRATDVSPRLAAHDVGDRGAVDLVFGSKGRVCGSGGGGDADDPDVFLSETGEVVLRSLLIGASTSSFGVSVSDVGELRSSEEVLGTTARRVVAGVTGHLGNEPVGEKERDPMCASGMTPERLGHIGASEREHAVTVIGGPSSPGPTGILVVNDCDLAPEASFDRRETRQKSEFRFCQHRGRV